MLHLPEFLARLSTSPAANQRNSRRASEHAAQSFLLPGIDAGIARGHQRGKAFGTRRQLASCAGTAMLKCATFQAQRRRLQWRNESHEPIPDDRKKCPPTNRCEPEPEELRVDQ